MFGRLAHFMYRRRWYVVGAWAVVLVLAGMLAAQVGSVLGPGDFSIKSSDSGKALALLEQKLNQNDHAQALVLIRNDALTIDNPRFQQAVATIIRNARHDTSLYVTRVTNPFDVALDKHSESVLFSSTFPGHPSDATIESKMEDQISHLRSIVRMPGFTTYVLGTPAVNYDYAVDSKSDLSRGESVTVPILLVILMLVFGTLVAASLPLMLAVFSIVLSLALVFVFGHMLDTSIYVTNVVTVLGLGIGIDYSLFIVYRFREELETWNGDVERAIVRTMETTGRAVFFSGVTVAIGLSSLLLTKLSFMESMGLGGMLVPFTALLVAMTLLPAVLGLLGTKVNRIRVLPSRFLRPGDRGPWHRLATVIMRRPIVSGGLVLIILLALAFPMTQLAFSFGSFKNAPQVESVVGYEYMTAHFRKVDDPAQVVIQAPAAKNLLQPSQIAGMKSLEQRLRQDAEVRAVYGAPDVAGISKTATAARGASPYLSADGSTGVIAVVGRHEVGTKQAEDLVRRIRKDVIPFLAGPLKGDTIYVGGSQAGYTDWNDAIYSKFPLIIAIVLALTYVFLFFAFRSVFLPLKAVLLNLLSVGASYGMLVLVFQHGVASSLLGFTPESGVASWVPIFLFAFLFGLSMDYEVFLLSRIRERWLSTGYNRESVAYGLEKTGRLISSAAAIMVIAFSGFVIGHEIQLKEFGFGMLASVALDASLIRVVLVPSIMEIMGDWNWWVPGFLREFARGGASLEGGETDVAAQPEPEPVGVPS